MIRNLFLATLIALSVAGSPAAAESVQDVIVAQLAQQGFTKIRISRTFLGRVRIVATSAERKREIIFNPRTGEILRDYWDDLDGGNLSGPTIVSPFGSGDDQPGSGRGSTSGDDDDSGDDSGDDDTSDDDGGSDDGGPDDSGDDDSSDDSGSDDDDRDDDSGDDDHDDEDSSDEQDDDGGDDD